MLSRHRCMMGVASRSGLVTLFMVDKIGLPVSQRKHVLAPQAAPRPSTTVNGNRLPAPDRIPPRPPRHFRRAARRRPGYPIQDGTGSVFDRKNSGLNSFD